MGVYTNTFSLHQRQPDYLIRRFINIHACCINPNFRVFRNFIWAIDPCKIFQLPRSCFSIKSLDIALLCNGQRGINKNFKKFIGSTMLRTISRSDLNGDIKAVTTSVYHQFCNFPTRRIFSILSASVKPKSLFNP